MVEKEKRITIWYDELSGDEFNLVGKKNANLGEMTKAKIPVSPGFALTIYANDLFITETGIKDKLRDLVKSIDKFNLENSRKVSEFAVELIENTPIPASISDQVFEDYKKLCEMSGVENVPVATRSSGAVSMPGQMETYLNVRGEEDLLKYIKKTWASAYFVEAITYRMDKDMPFILNIGVGVPKMVNSRVSGIIFTMNPLNGDRSKISVDVSYGLGEAVVSGLVTPDNYLIDKITLDTITATKGEKKIKMIYREDGSTIKEVEVAEEERNKFSINQEELTEICRIAKGIDKYYGKPYDIEFAVDADLPFPQNVIVLQVRPESVWSKKESQAKTAPKKDVMDRILGTMVAGVKLKKS